MRLSAEPAHDVDGCMALPAYVRAGRQWHPVTGTALYTQQYKDDGESDMLVVKMLTTVDMRNRGGP